MLTVRLFFYLLTQDLKWRLVALVKEKNESSTFNFSDHPLVQLPKLKIKSQLWQLQTIRAKWDQTKRGSDTFDEYISGWVFFLLLFTRFWPPTQL